MREKKWFIPFFSFYDITGMEAYLEKMAQKGWMLDHITNMTWNFRRCTPKTVHFAVTYYPTASAFEPEPSDGQQTFREFCDHAGWKCVGENAQMMIFANEQENPVPIHTDPEVEIETLERMSKRILWLWIMLAVILGFNFCNTIHQLFYDPIHLLSSSIMLISSLSMAGLTLYAFAELFTWFRWRKRARAAAEQGEFLPTHGCHRILEVVMAIFVLGIIYGLLTVRQTGFRLVILFSLAGYVVLFVVVNGVRELLKKKKVSTGKNRVITLVVDFVLAFVMFGGIMWFISHTDHSPEMALDTPLLTTEALTGQSDPDRVTESDVDSSLFLSRSQFWQHPPYDQETSHMDTLHYEQLDVHFSPLYGLCLRHMLHQYDHYGDHSPGYDENNPFYVYQEIDPAPWGASAAYQRYSYGEANSVYLLCWENRLVVLEPSWMLSPEQITAVKTAFAP